jgi:aconitase B
MDVWSEIVKEKIESLSMHFLSSWQAARWYEQEAKVKDLIKLSSAFKIDNEELIRAHDAMRNAAHNLRIHTEAMASKVKHHADKWDIRSTEEDMT